MKGFRELMSEICIFCGKKFRAITHTHLKKEHNISSVKDYRDIKDHMEKTNDDFLTHDFGEGPTFESLIPPTNPEPVVEPKKVSSGSEDEFLNHLIGVLDKGK